MYKDQTRQDLALAAFELAKASGLAEVRVPQIAATAGVSTRTFNNYFGSKEQAIAWLAGRRAAGVATALRDRPTSEPMGQALIEAVASVYQMSADRSVPQNFPRDYQELVAREPALHRAHLAAVWAAERDLADAIAERAPAMPRLRAEVLAGMVFGAERAAIRHWMKDKAYPLRDMVREALEQAVAGTGSTP
jgi:AcrR family transcriptional regulator